MSNKVDPHVEANLEVIREYLRGEFKGFEVADKLDGVIRQTNDTK
jgi:hypothetical protein